jgi:hypothetical protein
VSDPEPPRVRVHLPGDAPARLLRWRQDQDGHWWAEVTTYVPADAVRPVDGEDYTAVPREPATPPAPGYVIQTLPSGQLVLHRADCWAATGGRITPVPAGVEATALRFPDTEPCEICQPAP